MKKLVFQSQIFASTILAVMLILSSCGTSTAQKESAPEMDLHTAAMTGDLIAVKQHIAAGSDLNERDPFGGSSPLISAAFFGRPEIVKLLLDRKADKTIKNKYNTTAYDNVAAPFANVKEVYDVIGGMMEPMGLKLDYAYLEKIRPQIAKMLN